MDLKFFFVIVLVVYATTLIWTKYLDIFIELETLFVKEVGD